MFSVYVTHLNGDTFFYTNVEAVYVKEDMIAIKHLSGDTHMIKKENIHSIKLNPVID